MINVGGFEIGKFPDGTPMIKERHLINTEQEDDVLNFPYRRIYWLYESMEEFPTLCMVAEHLREHGYKVSLHMPYIPNARMDRTHDEDVFTLKYFCKMLNAIGFYQVHTLDAHSNVSIALIDRCKNYNPSVFIQQAIDKFNPDAIYFPDAGAMKPYQAIVPALVDKVMNWDGDVFFTRDTHQENYLETAEGKNLPVKHCIEGTEGWEIIDELKPWVGPDEYIFDKKTFGSVELANWIADTLDPANDSVTFVGVCTDICVVSNALLAKACSPELTIYIDASCCAGTSKEAHEAALKTMQSCQIKVKKQPIMKEN